MAGASLIWRLEEGYSRFVEGSRVELRLQEGPFRQILDVSPVGLIRRSRPVDLNFLAARGFSGRGPGKLRWHLRPEGLIAARVLFSRNAFWGNFRVPTGHFAIQWSVEVRVEGELGKAGESLFLNFDSGSRLLHSWVRVFPNEGTVREALAETWKSYTDPFDPVEIFRLPEGQLVKWSWKGRIRFQMGAELGLGLGWTIPGKIPLLDIRKVAGSGASAGVQFQTQENGEFTLQARKRNGNLEFRLRRERERSRQTHWSAGLYAGTQVEVLGLGPAVKGLLGILAEGLASPARKKMNHALREAVSRQLQIALAVELARWRRTRTALQARWTRPDEETFLTSYAQLLKGTIPAFNGSLKLTGRLERIRGRKVSVQLNILNWLHLHRSRERESQQNLIIDPRGNILLEEVEKLEKARYHWDEIEFLRLIQQETTTEAGVMEKFLWTYSRQDRFSREELRQFLRMLLHVRIVPEFLLPPESAFPASLQIMVTTSFLARGLEGVRQASKDEKWAALVRSLELAEADRYAAQTFWRDWIDYSQVRENIDRDPVQASLVTHYPVEGRNEFERLQVVTAYRKARRFMSLLERWSAGDPDEVFKTFTLGLDIPIFLFFHLLCPPSLRRSAAAMVGDFEQVWGDTKLLQNPYSPNSS